MKLEISSLKDSMHLALFFSRGVSLKTWAKIGSLEREIALYLRLKEKGVRVSFVTYGGPSDLQYQEQLGEIKILNNKYNLPLQWYERMLPLLHGKSLLEANIFKTNQINGGDLAMRAAKIWRKPLIARCGYMWSDFARRQGDPNQLDLAMKIEKKVFENAQRTFVTTLSMKNYVKDKYHVSDQTIFVVPNYVLTELFTPDETKPFSNRICFIGRLHEQKNLFSLVKACSGLDVELHFVGEGQLRSSLMDLAKNLNVKLVLHGKMLHHRLPEMIRQSAIFALVSHYEGHPKTLIEAMSCGAAVLGADSPGISKQISHGETGWLVQPNAESIKKGIKHLLANPSLRKALGQRAREYIQNYCSLEKIVELEYSLIRDLLKES